MAELDLVVIGAGPGGYVAAIRAAQLGLRTTVVEQERAGGVCGNWGCIPSKAILADAELYRELRHAGSRGIMADGLRVDFARVLARSRQAAARQAQGVESLFRKHHIELVQGWGRPPAGPAPARARCGACGRGTRRPVPGEPPPRGCAPARARSRHGVRPPRCHATPRGAAPGRAPRRRGWLSTGCSPSCRRRRLHAPAPRRRSAGPAAPRGSRPRTRRGLHR